MTTHDDESWLREAARTTAVATAEDLSGTTLGRYRLERIVGRGGMGVVYVAHDEKLDRVVALKVLPVDALRDERRRKRFLREARIAAKIVDPNIATVFDAGEDGDRVFLAMEYVEGRTLRSELRENGKLAVADAVRIAADIARALARAHDAGVIHRDVKPDNVVLAKGGGVKVLDFGVAKLDDDQPSNAEESSLETRAGALVGTPAYMSPEQAKGTAIDARSDLFSFGVLLYELFAGKRPFDGKTPLDVLIAIDRDEPTPLSRIRSDVPRRIDALVRKCLAKDPARRPANAAEVLEELEAASHAPRSSRVSFLVGALGLGVIATALAIGSTSRRPTEERATTPTATVAPVASSDPPAASPPTASIAETAPTIASAAPVVAEKAAPRSAVKPKAAPSASAARPSQPGPLDEPK